MRRVEVGCGEAEGTGVLVVIRRVGVVVDDGEGDEGDEDKELGEGVDEARPATEKAIVVLSSEIMLPGIVAMT